jgi:hypothetical protein
MFYKEKYLKYKKKYIELINQSTSMGGKPKNSFDESTKNLFKQIKTSYIEAIENFELRRNFIKEFSRVTPTPDVIMKIHDVTEDKKIIEIGAGTGLWAYLLKKSGSEIVATDSFETDKSSEIKNYFPVEKLEAVTAIQQNQDCDVLMLICPEYNSDIAENAIKAFNGSTVIYIGEGIHGVNANDAFFSELYKNWKEFIFKPDIDVLAWPGFSTTLEIWRRK